MDVGSFLNGIVFYEFWFSFSAEQDSPFEPSQVLLLNRSIVLGVKNDWFINVFSLEIWNQRRLCPELMPDNAGDLTALRTHGRMHTYTHACAEAYPRAPNMQHAHAHGYAGVYTHSYIHAHPHAYMQQNTHT